MLNRICLLLSAVLLVWFVSGCSESITETKLQSQQIDWLDLIPEEEQLALSQQIQTLQAMPLHNEEAPGLDQQYGLGEVNYATSLAGENIRLAGFMVPLEGENGMVTEFILVPFFGACIHVPPPPANQMIVVRYETGIPASYFFDSIVIEGALEMTEFESNGIGIGYQMTATYVGPNV
ncbi:DUF3299 domain-containing protein [Vibrio breoganii]|uniref:DUF3299 domain-containing protein n=1 Tax=Vibrio breoganii TaxID=553239 RepID=UPI0002E39D64|nr:DUF3299 domain-containing protein [Vibrio breoganii]